MKREMMYVCVETDKDGCIEISQYQEEEEGRDVITLIPEQIDIVVKWLQDCKKDAMVGHNRPMAAATA
ncbi:MAG: hypothetical protein BIFFINMI_03197 [Phycisphaerae bacterium]|nr:hypothetical protein [Phycisphaerae bacterium]